MNSITQRLSVNLSSPEVDNQTTTMTIGDDISSSTRVNHAMLTGVVGNVSTLSSSNDLAMSLINGLGLAIAIIALLANILMWSVMVYDKLLRQNVTNAFVCNQTILDAVASLSIIITNIATQTAGGIRVTEGFAGTLWCWTINASTLLTMAVYSSQAGLVIITLERYFKIVHPIQHRNRFRPWMGKVGLVLPWIDGIVVFLIPSWARTRVSGHSCIKTWPSAFALNIYRIVLFAWQFLLPVFIFVFCYAKIIAVIRRQAKTYSSANQQNALKPSTSGLANTTNSLQQHQQQQQQQMSQQEKNVVKIMLMVIGSYFVCWFPIQIFYQISTFSPTLTTGVNMVSILALIAYVNIAINPIIYGAHFNIVGRIIRHLKRHGGTDQSVVDNVGDAAMAESGRRSTAIGVPLEPKPSTRKQMDAIGQRSRVMCIATEISKEEKIHVRMY